MGDLSDLAYGGFLGTWVLDPSSCVYEQGEPPLAGLYRIVEGDDGRLHFHVRWTDAERREHAVSFAGNPSGEPEPFAGGDLADTLSVKAVSPRELNSTASYRGVERMVAQRQLDETGRAMRVTQIVRLPTGESLANVAIYVKRPEN